MNDENQLILAHLVADWSARDSEREVLTFVTVEADGSLAGTVRSYGGLWREGQRLAQGLVEESMAPGQSFAIVMQNHPEFVDAMVASSIANTVFVPIDPRIRGAKLAYMLGFAECRGALVADYALAQFTEVLDGLDGLDWLWVLDTGMGAELPAAVRARWLTQVQADAAGPDLAIRASDPGQPMQMLYTSGTTGDPKAILAPYTRFGEIASLGPAIGLQSGDRPYTGLSLTHANAQIITLGNALMGGYRTVISRKFTKSRLWDITRAYGCTSFNLLGGMTTAVYAEPQRSDDGDNPVRFVFSAGMPAAIWQDFGQRFQVEIFEFYGTAEGGITLNPPGHGPIGSIGRTPPTLVCSVRDEDDNECPEGVLGELCFQDVDGRPPPVTYYKEPEASAAKTRDGWFRSGDIGHMRDGWVYFAYRDGSGIRRNGDFVNPAFIEKVLAEVETISDVFVYGLATPANAPGEKEVVAALVVEPDFSAAAVFAACRAGLESNFVPGFLQVVDEIPKTASEKPQERFLAEAFDAAASNVFRAGG
ncbi:MAG: AMP-binding protein [Alphaproteobacteria bacterium]|jgi:crotonobetaine/carnitine-CoA ligase|nr:AMP-binding protein [Alphaproteobacteria bacterium]HJP21042.1 AMP-binding protein [Alphaproteobacteria bacterium]